MNTENYAEMGYILGKEEFKQFLSDNIRYYLPEKYQDAEISYQSIKKQGGIEYEAVLIHAASESATPTISIDEFYERYVKEDHSLERVLNEIADCRTRYADGIGLSREELTDFEKVKGNIYPRLINYENSMDYLKDVVYTTYKDLAVTYAADLGISMDNGYMTMPITSSLLEIYGISKEELHEIAIDNLSRQEPVIKAFSETVEEIIGMPKGSLEQQMPNMYVVTSQNLFDGANMLLNEQAMNKLSDIMCGDFVVIPSSTHEFLVFPPGISDSEYLSNMVLEVNKSAVGRSEQLSNHIYMYDGKEHRLMMPQEYDMAHSPKQEQTVVKISEHQKSSVNKNTKAARLNMLNNSFGLFGQDFGVTR